MLGIEAGGARVGLLPRACRTAAPAGSAGQRARPGSAGACHVLRFGAALGVLPAFGAFTGMHVLPRAPADRVYGVAGEQVRALNSAA